MIIEIILRDVTESDLPIFYEQQLDPEATQMAAFPSRDRESFMTHWAKIMADDSNILKTILFQDQVAGNIVSWGQASEREVGYWLGRNFWGKGIATKALTEFLIIEKIRPLVAHVVKHNIGSRRVLEKCGFTLSKEEIEEVILKLV